MNEDIEAIREVWRPVIRHGLVNIHNQHLLLGAPQMPDEERDQQIDDATEDLLRGMFPDQNNAKKSQSCELTARKKIDCTRKTGLAEH
jgi:hypothetical protein